MIVNTSISSELPLPYRDITVTLGSQTQFQSISVPNQSTLFQFGQVDFNRKDYPLKMYHP